jgi:hypothetical protein
MVRRYRRSFRRRFHNQRERKGAAQGVIMLVAVGLGFAGGGWGGMALGLFAGSLVCFWIDHDPDLTKKRR